MNSSRLGFLLLGIWLLVTGLLPLTGLHFPYLVTSMATLGFLSGILIISLPQVTPLVTMTLEGAACPSPLSHELVRDGTNNANGTVTPEEEIAYIQRAGEGDAQAFEFLYENYVHRIYNLVFRIVGTAGEAEEVTQEVFCQAFRGLAGFEGRSRFYTWIYRIATNLSVQHLQNNARIREFASLEDLAQVRGREAISSLEDPEKSVQKREFFQKLEDALGMLNPYHRTVLTLGPIQGHSHEEIGAILDLTPEVVKARLQRARAHLRELMNAYR